MQKKLTSALEASLVASPNNNNNNNNNDDNNNHPSNGQVDFTGTASAQLSYHSLTWTGNNALIPAVCGMDVLLLPISHAWHGQHTAVIQTILAAPQDAVQSWLPVWASCLTPLETSTVTTSLSFSAG